MKLLFFILAIFAFSCTSRTVAVDADRAATCTAKCYDLLCTKSSCEGKYIGGRYLGDAPEGHYVCECLEKKIVEKEGKVIIDLERKFVVERKIEKK